MSYCGCWFIILIGTALAGSNAINSWAMIFAITKAFDLFVLESFGAVVKYKI